MSPALMPSAAPFPYPLASLPGVPAGMVRSTEALAALAHKRIFFAHHSLGADILAGVRSRLEDAGIILRVSPGTECSSRGGRLLHAGIGHHGDPAGKLVHYAEYLAGLGEELEIAIFKFCDLDVTAATEVGPLFAAYRHTMEGINRRYPHLRLVHCTIPLSCRQSGPTASLKRFLGRPVEGVEDNLARQRFNDLLRRTYGRELFDLAAVQSTWPDGRREIVFHQGEAGYAMVPAYSDGKGHLNGLGQQVVADRLLAYLSNLD